jgi:CRP-like cAMP-binding protein
MSARPRPSAAELRGFAFLAELPDHDIELLIAGSRRLQVQPPATVIEQGAADDHLFLIISGQLSAHVDGRQVALLEAGEPVGELSATPTSHSFTRTATVRAETTAELIEIPAELVQQLAASHPALRSHFAALRAKRLSFDALTRHLTP